jgi:hypothetical protein
VRSLSPGPSSCSRMPVRVVFALAANARFCRGAKVEAKITTLVPKLSSPWFPNSVWEL